MADNGRYVACSVEGRMDEQENAIRIMKRSEAENFDRYEYDSYYFVTNCRNFTNSMLLQGN